MDDAAWLTLNVYMEARGEPQDGKAAVARVVMNRARLQYFSDGTVKNTVLRRDQFSWAWFDMVDGHYTRVCSTPEQAELRATHLYRSITQGGPQARLTWAACEDAAEAVLAGHYTGADYDGLRDDVVLYYNPDVVKTPPAWADPDKYEGRIGHHCFYRA